MITAGVTTPFIGGGARASSMVYSEVSSKIAAIKNPEDTHLMYHDRPSLGVLIVVIYLI